ncbi:hypothetical protein [Marinifilum sp. D737]|uniref:hypothetical protein n=1 Tax=Marinifilum sp. D737 TaxID=2969628 RepID=UPI0022748DD4|nr:hypothetical protein [Marinifilum sp. D737]MCY1634297.1 hypothetical protein [Marinifilum sp. D737]
MKKSKLNIESLRDFTESLNKNKDVSKKQLDKLKGGLEPPHCFNCSCFEGTIAGFQAGMALNS